MGSARVAWSGYGRRQQISQFARNTDPEKADLRRLSWVTPENPQASGEGSTRLDKPPYPQSQSRALMAESFLPRRLGRTSIPPSSRRIVSKGVPSSHASTRAAPMSYPHSLRDAPRWRCGLAPSAVMLSSSCLWASRDCGIERLRRAWEPGSEMASCFLDSVGGHPTWAGRESTRALRPRRFHSRPRPERMALPRRSESRCPAPKT
jgi:hypothetical protein